MCPSIHRFHNTAFTSYYVVSTMPGIKDTMIPENMLEKTGETWHTGNLAISSYSPSSSHSQTGTNQSSYFLKGREGMGGVGVRQENIFFFSAGIGRDFCYQYFSVSISQRQNRNIPGISYNHIHVYLNWTESSYQVMPNTTQDKLDLNLADRPLELRMDNCVDTDFISLILQ